MSNQLEQAGGWREQVLREFTAAAGELLLVADPDGVLGDDALQNALSTLGYDAVYYDDPFVFRAWYERTWRTSLERGGAGRSLALVLPVARANLFDAVPFDLARMGRMVDVGLARLFPSLDPSAVGALDPEHLDALWAVVQGEDAQRGPESSLDFLLREVFGIDLAGTARSRSPGTRLLAALLQMHFKGLHLPPVLGRRAVERAKGVYALSGWPLPVLFGDRAGFLAFLQRQWEAWVSRIAGSRRLLTSDIRASVGVAEALDIAFTDPEIVQSIEPYFLHGLLVPITLAAEAQLPAQYSWAVIGIDQDPKRDALLRLERLLRDVVVPTALAHGTDWIRFAVSLAEASSFLTSSDLGPEHELAHRLSALTSEGESAFSPWLRQRYGGLASLPSVHAPTMVHHTANFMASRLGAGAKRVALLVMDGLALDQWVLLRNALPPVGGQVTVDESASFAWIPTLTNVSRQAIFAGAAPWSFDDTIENTSAEGTWWNKCWDQRGIPSGQVRYLKNVDPAFPEPVLSTVADSGVRVIGMVVPLVDQLIHDFPLPRGSLVPVLAKWAREGYLSRLIGTLLDSEFEVFLTSDHGNVDARGMGAIDDGKVPDIRGQRVRVYSSAALRDAAKQRCPGTEPWTDVGLPAGFHALLSPGDRAFVADGGSLVCHGGASLREVLVPFVHFRREA